MHRWPVLLALAGASCAGPAGDDRAARPSGDVPPISWPLGRVAGRIGREVAPQIVEPLAIAGDDPPLRDAITWQLPGDGPARAIVSGKLGDRYAVELVEIDRRRVAWRDDCSGPVVGVTADVIACGDEEATRVLSPDGRLAWSAAMPLLALTGDRAVTGVDGGEVAIRDAKSGADLARVLLPPGFTPHGVIAACDRDIYMATVDGKLARIAGKLLWTTQVGHVIVDGDLCASATMLVHVVTSATEGALLVIARDTGRIVARLDGVRGMWPAPGRADRIDVATATGVTRMPRDLSAGQLLALPPLGALLATRGDRRLVRATATTAALIDARGVRAFVPLADPAAALGDDALLSSRLVAIPQPWHRPLRLPPAPIGLAVPAELRDLPAAAPLDSTNAIALPEIGMRGVAARALDPIDPALYVVALDAGAPTIARFDLAARAWTWHRPGACPPGADISLAASRAIVACATRGGVRATTREGAAAWQLAGNVDELAAAADVVVVRDADRVRIVDAAGGALLGTVASRTVAALDIAGMAIVVTVERGRVVARLPRAAMLPAWSIDVRGVVRSLAASGDGVLVALEDGDAYRIDARTTAIAAVPGVGLAWRALGDLITGEAIGGPVPPSPMPKPPPAPKLPAKPKPLDLEAAPAIATPWPPPPPMASSWQYTLFELGGGLRARNDYALDPPIAPATARGDGASPIVIAYGARGLLVIDPVRGDPLRRIELPSDAPADVAFSTIVDGRPVTGTILAGPLRVVVF